MAKKTNIEITPESVNAALRCVAQLHPKALTNANKAMLRDSANLLKKNTVREMRAAWPGATKTSRRWNGHSGYITPIKGVQTLIARNGYWAMVRISNPNSFLLPIFEQGTRKRYIEGKSSSATSQNRKFKNVRRYRKAGAYRGTIKPLKFFEKAREATNPEIEKLMNQAFVKNVQKQWEKRS